MSTVVTAVFDLCAERFDPASLNPKATVVTLEEPWGDTTLTLLGWDETRSAWRCQPGPGTAEVWVQRIADLCTVRRVVFFYHDRRLTVYPHEAAPWSVEQHQEWNSRLEERLSDALRRNG